MIEVMLLRHGKAKKSSDGHDFDRPLKERGKRGAQRTGAWLAQTGNLPARVICSPARRARESAEKCVKAMGATVERIENDDRLYCASASNLFDRLIEAASQTSPVMLVGHNPGLEQLAQQLLPESVCNQYEKLMPAGTLLRLALPETQAFPLDGGAALLERITPDELPDGFPWPAPNGRERRDRPAYYYTQSAAIPYRIQSGEVEVLLITSSSGRYWVLPKGIVEPGLSPQASAAKEAREEAGIEGNVQEQALGQYRQAKWGAHCDIQVYPMRVTRELPDKEWEETHRERRWLPLKQACSFLKNPDLAEIARILPEHLQGANP
ncbi:MAG: hypothetical protein CMI01_18285 [Oceanospirillaceae bacterium]|nr:hypothetical protein [Oceanospirillaceae bacterium]